MAENLVLLLPDDFHAHLRRGPAMAAYAERHAASFGRALVMPNTKPPVASAAEIAAYRREILAAAARASGGRFEPLMSFKLLAGMSRAAVLACGQAGAIAGKYYPAGATTGSEDGIVEPESADEALDAMEEAGIVLCIHGESPGAPALDREAGFLAVIDGMLGRHPRLRVVMEHISTVESLEFLRRAPRRVGATVTAHHLLCSLEDLLGGELDPQLFCRPVLKAQRHVDALRDAVLRGEPRLFFGSDSAPHPRSAKSGRRAPAGIYASPSALPALAGFFEAEGRLGALESFVARTGAAFYGLPPPRGSLELVRGPWTVPEELDGAVPFLSGRSLAWRLGRAAPL
ncbi:MAG TPA: amidohydrolase family protein [Rectinemataceae bacterium]|nr:amidohydrolase family protein [Rectinemataceae bacterium]